MAKNKLFKIFNSNKEIKDQNFRHDNLNKYYLRYENKNLKILNRFIDGLNLTLIVMIFTISFFSFRTQREWTNSYSNMIDLRNKNNNLIDYISKTEEYFLKEIELKDYLKKANPDDLIYLVKTKKQEKTNFLFTALKEISIGFNDGEYQKGY